MKTMSLKDASIEAKIFLNVKKVNPVDLLEGFEYSGCTRCTHSHIHFFKDWAGGRKEEINIAFIDDEGYVDYDLYCTTAAGKTRWYMLVSKDQHNHIHVALGSKLMDMSWVKTKENTKVLLGLLKKMEKKDHLSLVTERATNVYGYRTLRYGWCPVNHIEDDVIKLKTMDGFSTGLCYLPNHGAADASVIFLRLDKPEHPGWERLVQALHDMRNGGTIQHYAYVPCAGTLVNVKKVGDDSYKTWPEHQIEPLETTLLSLYDIFGSVADGYAVDNNLFPLLRKYFIKNSKKEIETAYCEDDYYFSLLHRAGISLAVEVAHVNGDTEMEKKLHSWVDAGMTDDESRQVWANSQMSGCYNHSYYWNNMVVSYETYGLNSPRHNVMCVAISQKAS